MNQLTSAQELQAARLAAEMANNFGLNFEEFSIIQGVPGLECSPTVAYVARLGINLGNWREIVGTRIQPAPKDAFVVKLEDEEFDARQGMTKAVYRAMVAQNLNNHNPDSPIRLIRGNFSFPKTWLTGEAATPHWAPVGQVNIVDGDAQVNMIGKLRDSSTCNFRPGIKLPDNL